MKELIPTIKDQNSSSLIRAVSAELKELQKFGSFESIHVEYKYQGQEQSGGFQVQSDLHNEP